ncbi:unnamed protein product [Zymoseptoria tritici ST99CH_1E4]|uniref:Uncharacterized protein n=1 Tax=Zymoseptoria tritici ST99CH_1E4 TaxID=1276532 RepID=A0A2H1G4W9_ZYMTR|nr:unnamed protein product [Zymoseptoria tritici ST99CH_1E4]
MDSHASFGTASMHPDYQPTIDCVNRCVTSLEQALANSNANKWYGTSIHAWDEERTRLLLWRTDLQTVILELSRSQPSQARAIARSSVCENLADLENELIEVSAVVGDLRLPLEQSEQLEVRASPSWPDAVEESSDDFHELEERLDVVRATIDGLFRTLKSQYSYALRLQQVSRDVSPVSRHEVPEEALARATQTDRDLYTSYIGLVPSSDQYGSVSQGYTAVDGPRFTQQCPASAANPSRAGSGGAPPVYYGNVTSWPQGSQLDDVPPRSDVHRTSSLGRRRNLQPNGIDRSAA